MHIDLSAKRVIVTGASRGIGRATAAAFAREGVRLAICSRNPDTLSAIAEDMRVLGAAEVIAVALDVRNTAAVRAFVNQVAETWGGVDVLVNNAGQGKGGSLETLEPEDILDHANNIQIAHFRFVQAVVPHMRAQQWGRIININALAGALPTPDGIPSVTNRAAGIALAKLLGQQLAKDNILVNSLNMGWIDTGQWDRHYKEMPPSISREEFLEMVVKVVPLGRFGRPEEVANVCLFLASDLATFLSAASIDVSGGLQGAIAYYPTLKREMQEMGLERQATLEAASAA
ncbi:MULTISPECIES: SDR family oxidoreductase [unclassified Caulobacter]|jgi:NAD(P)-dependent dehydrogenase (short-subunit alcohol dehydrogenase family)|uniref:SDR family oxidoreductase n=1 Tax=unclassified Caulobacter TaxID=2648921 RepID=UPI000781D1A0|nr:MULTISPECIES: SDR family oxidoreductase [unclassified Caulobacter]AZS19311.1 SDR family oxidoreductase [Caulobacter sp. FWC26]